MDTLLALIYSIREGKGDTIIRIRDLKTGAPGIYTEEEVSEDYLINPGDLIAGMDAEFTPTIWFGSKGLLNQRVCKFSPAIEGIGMFLFTGNRAPTSKFL
jgi:type I restriction enzyme S subunit